MRVIKAIIAIVMVNTVLSNAAGEEIAFNNISAYYGFGEMEIIKLDWDIKALTIADFNGDKRKDIAVVNDRKSQIELLIQKEAIGPGETDVSVDPQDVDINQIKPPSRFYRDSVPVSQKVYGFVCGDLNSDGLTDLAFYGEPEGLYVIFQKADQTRESATEKGIPKKLSWHVRKKIKIDDDFLPSSPLPGSKLLVCADLNNDGRDDLVLAGRKAVHIILQKEDGSLAEPVKYPVSAMTLGIEVRDLNGDNINDLILITNDDEKPVHVRFGLPTGQFGPEVQFFIEKPWVFTLYDVDNDGCDEILTIDYASKRLVCYKYAAETEKDADWPILFYPLASGRENTKRDLLVGDFDGDGLADVVISDPEAAELIFYKQTKETGLTEPVRFPAFADIESLSAADIDGDGKSEIAVLSVKEKVIGLSKYKDDRLTFPKPIDLCGEPLAMELADVDGDGKIDCVYVSKDANDARFLRVIYDVNSAIKAEQDQSSKTSGLRLAKLSSNPDGLKVLDVDHDGLQDVLIFEKYNPPPLLVRQTQKRKFEVVDSPKAQSSLIKDASIASIAVADVDKQGTDELLVAQKNFARSLVFAKGESWSIIDQYNAKSTENNISAVAAFDMHKPDPAGRPDILLLDGTKGQLQILETDADKTYRYRKELNVGRWNSTAKHLKMLFAPLTGNEAKSIVLFDSEKFALITPPRVDKFQHHLEQMFNYETKIKDGVYGNLAAGDINSDKRADIVMVEYNQNHIEILALDSENKPVPAMRFKLFEQKSYREELPNKSSVEPREMRIADVTGDGKDDLVTIIHDRIIIYPQD